MRIIGQLGLIFFFGFCGEVLARCVPLGIPTSVWGLLLLLAALRLGAVKADTIDETAQFLGANMGFFFLPPAVMILGNYDILRPALFRLVVILTVSTALTFLAAYYAARAARKDP